MEQFQNLHADLNELISETNHSFNDCYGTNLDDCFPITIFNDSFNANSLALHFSMEQIFEQCSNSARDADGRKYLVAIMMGIFGTLGLFGNLLSCIVIATYLLRVSGTFVLFLLLSIADSVVVIVQIIDAYRHSVWVDVYMQIDPEQIHDPIATRNRNWNCKLFFYFWHLSLQYAAWVVMVLSVDRFVSLRRIHVTHSRVSVYRRAWIIGGTILIFLALLNLPFIVYAKSAVSKTLCGFTHYCIYSSTGSVNKNTTFDSLWDFHNDPLFQEHENTEYLSSRQISLWLSRQHLVVFGIIPYTVTFLFNIILIHHLRSCPQPGATTKKGACLQRIPYNPSKSDVVENKQTRLNHSFRCCCPNVWTIRRQKSTGALPLVSHPGTDPVKATKTESFTYRGLLQPVCRSYGPSKNQYVLTAFNRSPTNFQTRPLRPYSQLYEKHVRAPTCLCLVRANGDGHPGDTAEDPARKTGDKCYSNFQDPVHFDASSSLQQRRSLINKRRRSSVASAGWWVGQTRITMLLLAVTVTFIVLTAPYMIYTELKQFRLLDVASIGNYRNSHLFEELCRFLLFINNGLNFLVYMTGRQFRRGLKQFMHRVRRVLTGCPICQPEELQNRWYCHPPDRNRKRNLIITRRDGNRVYRVVYHPSCGRIKQIDQITPPDGNECSLVACNGPVHLFNPLYQR